MAGEGNWEARNGDVWEEDGGEEAEICAAFRS
jgi:hypothetical protein